MKILNRVKFKTKNPYAVTSLIIFIIIFVIFGSYKRYLGFRNESNIKDVHNILTLFPEGSHEDTIFKKLDVLSSKYFFVGSHGTPGSSKDGIEWLEDGRNKKHKINIDIYAAANIILEEMKNRGIPTDRPIFLMACNVGAGKEPYAMKLSKLVTTDVYAVNGWLGVDYYGLTNTSHRKVLTLFGLGGFEFRHFKGGNELPVADSVRAEFEDQGLF